MSRPMSLKGGGRFNQFYLLKGFNQLFNESMRATDESTNCHLCIRLEIHAVGLHGFDDIFYLIEYSDINIFIIS